jgi:hypothetical protein
MKIYKAPAVAAVGVIAFVAGMAFNMMRNPDNTVRTEIVNQSDQLIRSFTVLYSTCGTETQITGQRLAAGKSRTIRFPICGEGGYALEVTLADGRVLKRAEGYVESGYSTIDTITPHGIASRQRMSYALR